MATKQKKKNSTKRTKRVVATRPWRPRLGARDLAEILTFAKGLARASGALAMSFYGKANPTLRYDYDLVTEADLALNEYLFKEVSGTFPDHLFYGAQSVGKRRRKNLKEIQDPVWVVDPLDGSAGFSAGMPVWAVSLALFDSGRPVLGIIHLPVTGELYSATRSGPAMLNDREISVRDQDLDNESLLLTYSRFHSDFIVNLTGKVRSLGSSAAHMAFVARGAASAAVLGNVHIWDIAAGQVVLAAAGGAILDLNGRKVELADYSNGGDIDKVLIAAPMGLHKEISGLLERR